MNIPAQNIDEKLERKVEHILISKSKMIYGIIIVMVPILAFFFKIQLDVALIKENHEAHMEAALEKIANLENGEKELMNKLDTDHDAIIRLLQMHTK